MSIVIVSPTDSPEAVAAAMGDLATNKPADDKKPSEEKPLRLLQAIWQVQPLQRRKNRLKTEKSNRPKAKNLNRKRLKIRKIRRKKLRKMKKER